MVAEWVSTTRRWPSCAWLAATWATLAERKGRGDARNAVTDVIERASTVRYHLGRGRRAREAGRFDDACSSARRAIDANPGNPWAYALLGQCLTRKRQPDLVEARRTLERACALDPSNGYFVRLLLEVLDAQGDTRSREDVLAWAWWNGAPVERWLPNGAYPRRRVTPAPTDAPTSDSVDSGTVPRVPAATGEPAVAPARLLV